MADIELESTKFEISQPERYDVEDVYELLEVFRLFKVKIDAQSKDIEKLANELKDVKTRLTNGGL